MAATQTTHVYEDLRYKILHSGYAPSENLPEADLAAAYSVSRNTIKKALMMLENDGLVVIEPNKGAKVRSYSKVEVMEFLEVREVLEEKLMRLAVPMMTPADFEKLDEIIEQMKLAKSEGRLSDYSSGNRAFHWVFYDACPNRTLAQLIVNLKNQMRKYNSKTVLIPGRSDKGYQEHLDILDAARNGDVEAAAAAIAKHVQGVRKVFEDNFDLLF